MIGRCRNNNNSCHVLVRWFRRSPRGHLGCSSQQQQQHPFPSSMVQQQRRMRHTVVYALGEGWTGALGTGRLDQCILGHLDEDSTNDVDDSITSPNQPPSSSIYRPVVILDTQHQPEQRLLSCAVGWGHTALLVESTAPSSHNIAELGSGNPQLQLHASTMLPEQQQQQLDQVPTVTSILNDSESLVVSNMLPSSTSVSSTATTTTTTQLFVTGRPHEFASLLRLQRLPQAIRQWLTDHTYRTVRSAKLAETSDTDGNKERLPLNPIDMIGRTLTFLSKCFGNPKSDPNWNAARDQSFMVVPTSIPLPFNTVLSPFSSTTAMQISDNANLVEVDPTKPVNDDALVHVACSAGITAVTTALGYVYTFGLNGMGQCGTGHPCNNVWEPSRVTGLSREFSAKGYRGTTLAQSYPIQQTVLGLQRTLVFFFQKIL
jgi:hypothetical protein